MARFLTDEWIAQMDRAAASPGGPRVADGELVIQHVVTDLPDDLAEVSQTGTDGRGDVAERAFHLVLSPATATVRAGRSAQPTVSFTSSYRTASAIAAAASNAQAEFMAGNLRVGGAVDQLMIHHGALAAAEDVFATVRAETEY